MSRAIAVLLVALTAAVGAQDAAASRPASRQAFEESLGRLCEQFDVPALGGAAVSSDGIVVIGVAGVRARGRPERVTLEDLWHIGSCTKAMTATLIGRLVDRGVLRFEDTLGGRCADFEELHADYAPVTVEQLLAHRGGVPSDLSFDGLWSSLWSHKGTPIEQRRTLFDAVLRRPPLSKPGSAFLYSNASFAIAGVLAERATGKSYEDLMRAEVFEPLGMTSAGFGAPGSAEVYDQPRGHDANGKPVEPGRGADNPPAIAPAGTVHLTLGDWAKYQMAHLHGAAGKSTFLAPATFRRMQAKPPTGDYAFGWSHQRRGWGGRVLTHNGSNTMWYCAAWLAPERDRAFLAVCNEAGQKAAVTTDLVIASMVRAMQGR